MKQDRVTDGTRTDTIRIAPPLKRPFPEEHRDGPVCRETQGESPSVHARHRRRRDPETAPEPAPRNESLQASRRRGAAIPAPEPTPARPHHHHHETTVSHAGPRDRSAGGAVRHRREGGGRCPPLKRRPRHFRPSPRVRETHGHSTVEGAGPDHRFGPTSWSESDPNRRIQFFQRRPRCQRPRRPDEVPGSPQITL